MRALCRNHYQPMWLYAEHVLEATVSVGLPASKGVPAMPEGSRRRPVREPAPAMPPVGSQGVGTVGLDVTVETHSDVHPGEDSLNLLGFAERLGDSHQANLKPFGVGVGQ
jgi:hypothetical protein